MANIQLTQEYVKYLFDYKDGFLYWKVRKANSVQIGDRVGFIRKIRGEDRYVVKINGYSFLGARIIFLYHKGFIPPYVDHENNNSIDNRIENLREATKAQNNKNSSSRKGSTSKYLGVHFNNEANKWVAKITNNGKCTYIGRFLNEIEAALAYNKYAVKLFVEFANLNIITV